MTSPSYSLRTDFDALCALVDQHVAVEFELFDTLVVRPFNDPFHLFQWIEAKLVREDGRYAQFRWMRPPAEMIARGEAHKSGFEDVSLDEIYEVFARTYRDDRLPPAARPQELEIEAQVAHCRPNRDGIRLLEYALAQGKKVIVSTETALPRSAIEAMLERCGAPRGLTLLLSHEQRLVKWNGNLHKSALRKFGCKPAEALHVAHENGGAASVGMAVAQLSDGYDNAVERLGFPGSRCYEVSFPFQSATLSMLRRAIAEGEADEVEPHHAYWFLIGYTLVAPLMMSLAFWVRDEAKRAELEKVLFLARDGLIVKRVYDALFAGRADAIASEYMYASRRMLSVPFRTVNGHSLYLYYADYVANAPTVGALFEKLPGTDRWIELAQAEGIDLAMPVASSRANKKRMKQLVAENAQIIFDALAPEQEPVRAYLRSVVGDSKRIALFDIGWWGSLQRAFETALADDGLHVAGLYFSLLDGARIAGDPSRVRGYLVRFGRPFGHAEVLDKGLSFFEVLFYGDHGSLETVRQRSDGSFEPVMIEGPRELDRIARARVIHRAVLLHVERALATFGFDELASLYDREEVIEAAMRHTDTPFRVDAKNFVGMNFSASLGDDEGSPIIDGGVLSLQRYFWAVERSHWKQGARAFGPERKAMAKAKKLYAGRKTLWRSLKSRARAAWRAR